MSTLRNISNSEVGSWLTCRNQYRYAFDLNLEPIHQSDPLSKGTLGHEILDWYYTALKAGRGHDTSVSIARERLGSYFSVDSPYAMDIVTEVARILALYWSMYEGDPGWTIMQVEEMHTLPLSEEYAMPMRLDMLVKDEEGKIALVDHKFFYDMPNQDKLDLNVQFPKYIGALAMNGIKVDYCVLNVLRTRKMKNPALTDLFKRYRVNVSSAKVRKALATHILASEEISEYRSLPEAVRPSRAIPIFNDMICKNCNFKGLCSSEFDGGDITYLIATEYKQNTYGYNTPTIEEGLL